MHDLIYYCACVCSDNSSTEESSEEEEAQEEEEEEERDSGWRLITVYNLFWWTRKHTDAFYTCISLYSTKILVIYLNSNVSCSYTWYVFIVCLNKTRVLLCFRQKMNCSKSLRYSKNHSNGQQETVVFYFKMKFKCKSFSGQSIWSWVKDKP